MQAAIAAVTERKNEEIAQLQRQLSEAQRGAEQQRAAAAAEAAAAAAAELASLRHQLEEARRWAHVSVEGGLFWVGACALAEGVRRGQPLLRLLAWLGPFQPCPFTPPAYSHLPPSSNMFHLV